MLARKTFNTQNFNVREASKKKNIRKFKFHQLIHLRTRVDKDLKLKFASSLQSL